MINGFNHPDLAWILAYWPVMIFLPSILLLIGPLALIMRWWDERDADAGRQPGRTEATDA